MSEKPDPLIVDPETGSILCQTCHRPSGTLVLALGRWVCNPCYEAIDQKFCKPLGIWP